MEAKEKKKGIDEVRGIMVESKGFSVVLSQGIVILKEVHKQGERELYLTIQQARWIAQGLVDRNTNFDDTSKKESRDFSGILVSLIEGSNRCGCYVSIQVRKACEESRYIVVPAG